MNDNETYIKFRFIDSFRFLGTSLEKLAYTLPQNKFENLQTTFNLNDSSLKLLTRNGVFPYDCIDPWDKLNETCLPPNNDFHNKLNDCGLSQEDYNHAKNVFSDFNVPNLGEY